MFKCLSRDYSRDHLPEYPHRRYLFAFSREQRYARGGHGARDADHILDTCTLMFLTEIDMSSRRYI